MNLSEEAEMLASYVTLEQPTLLNTRVQNTPLL